MRRRFVALAIGAYCGLATIGALAHSWYPTECCSDKDCAPVAESEIKDGGSTFIYKGIHFPKRDAKVSPDDKYHVCYRNGLQCTWTGCTSGPPKILCMWRPYRGA